MTNRKKTKKHKQPQKQSKTSNGRNTGSKPKPNLKMIKSILSFLIAISGILFALHPRYSIDVGDTYNPRIPFENPLMITNLGYFPLALDYGITAPYFVDRFMNTYSNISAGRWHIENLNADRRIAIDLSRFIKTNTKDLIISEMDILIEIKAKTRIFKMLKYPYSKNEAVRFKLKRTADGSYKWQPNG